MIVSRGIGNSIIPVRINNRPEIIIIELNCGWISVYPDFKYLCQEHKRKLWEYINFSFWNWENELVGALLYISLWHIQRSPGTVKTVPYSLFYIAVQTYKWSVGRDALIPPRKSLADRVKPCEFVQILFTICPRIAGRNCVKFIRITKNELSALYSIDKCVPKGYCNSNSSAKCNEQEMTYPYHRLQKAVICEKQ